MRRQELAHLLRAACQIVEDNDVIVVGSQSILGTYDESDLPAAGWQDRLVAWDLRSSEPSNPRFLEPHDLAVSKLCAHRDKDRAFVTALLDAELLDAATINDRAELLEGDNRDHIPTIAQWIDGWTASRTTSKSAPTAHAESDVTLTELDAEDDYGH